VKVTHLAKVGDEKKMATSSRGAGQSEGKEEKVATEGIGRTRERRRVIRPVSEAIPAKRRAPASPSKGHRKTASEEIEGGQHEDKGGGGGGDGGKRGETQVEERSSRDTATKDETVELDEWKGKVGAGVWEEVRANDGGGTYKKHLEWMRHIAQWEREPPDIYDTKMPERTQLAADVRPSAREWQAFIRRYLRGATYPEVRALVNEAIADASVTELYAAVRKNKKSTDLHWPGLDAAEISALLIGAAEEYAAIQSRLVSVRPSTLSRPPERPTPVKALANYFPGKEGATVLAQLNRFDIHTHGQLRAMSRKVRLALEEEESPVYEDVLNGFEKLEVDGSEDRRMRLLYEAGAPTSLPRLARYHAVYEWLVAKQNVRDTEVASWAPSLKPGLRVTVRTTYTVEDTSAAAAARRRRQKSRWPNSGGAAADGDTRLRRIVRFVGTVRSFHPRSSSTSSSNTVPASCVVLLDADQFRRPQLAEEQRRLTFVSRSPDDVKGVERYLAEHLVAFKPDAPFAHITWGVSNTQDLVPLLRGIHKTALPGDAYIETPDGMVAGLIRALAVPGERIRVSRSIFIPILVLSDGEGGLPFDIVASTVEGRVLGGTRSRGLKGPIEGLKLWVDGHIVDFALPCAPATNCNGLEIENLVGERTESPDTLAQAHVSYSFSPVATLRAQLQRVAIELPPKLGDYAPLTDLVLDMLL
jgi:hypothetical protein